MTHIMLEDPHHKAAENSACSHSAEEFLDSILMDSGKPYTFASTFCAIDNTVLGEWKLFSPHSWTFSQVCIDRQTSAETDMPFAGQPRKTKQTTDGNPGERPLDLFRAIFEDDSD